ncbi:astacin-like metalloendopeptidase [Ambystoma mexicanum]|uniref:astacin-like metalloendopeptidase n=1 Tax=Ambystoma mexicanum TaxID=8296 RepID=UPI0037E9A64B
MQQGDIATMHSGHSAVKCPGKACFWPKSSLGTVIVPYTISSIFGDRHRTLILAALEELDSLTCIKFVNRTTEQDYLKITSEDGCWSHIGKTGGGQTVSVAESGCMSRGIIQHEVAHSLGFYHEHTRSDRDLYVDIQLQYISEGDQVNFNKQDTDNLGLPYDYTSVMHYGRYAFSNTPGQPSIVPKPDPKIEIGQRYGLSSLDVAKINKLYECGLCSTLLSAVNGTLASPNYPDSYGNDTSCLWLIRIQGDQVVLQFEDFDLQAFADCDSDYIRVYDGSSRLAPVLLDKACGRELPPLLVASGPLMLVEFVSDGNVTGGGFMASYDNVKCGGTFNKDDGVIISPGFPDLYPNSVDCVWTILAPIGQQIQLTFTSFNVEHYPECDNDYLAVCDGGSVNSTILGKYCGDSLIQPITSTGNILLLQFHSDMWVNKPGFSATYSFSK